MGLLKENTSIGIVRALVAVLLAAALAASCSHLKLGKPVRMNADDWPTLGGNISRTNRSTEDIVPPLTLAWTQDVTGGIGNGSPLVVDSLVIVGTLRGELYVLNARTGKQRGWIGLGEAITGAPVVDGSVAFVGASNTDESLVAYDMNEGKTIWEKGYGDIETSPLLGNGKLYFGNTVGEFFCVEGSKGEQIWKFQMPGNIRQKGIRSSAALEDGTVVFGSEDGSVYALDAETGNLKWKYATDQPVVASAAAVDGSVYMGNLGGEFYSLDLRSGTLRWKISCGTSIYASAAISPEHVVVATTGGSLFSLRREDGTIVWKTNLGSVINAAPVIAGNYIYVGTLKKILYGVRASDGEVVYSYAVPGRIKTASAIAYGRLFVASDERLILAFTGEEGK